MAKDETIFNERKTRKLAVGKKGTLHKYNYKYKGGEKNAIYCKIKL